MARKNERKRQYLAACVNPNGIKDKRNCECCGRLFCNYVTCGNTRKSLCCKHPEAPKCCAIEESAGTTSSASYDCQGQRKCIRSTDWICKNYSKVEKCGKNVERVRACENGTRRNVCKHSGDSFTSPCDSSNVNNVCNGMDRKDVCPMEREPITSIDWICQESAKIEKCFKEVERDICENSSFTICNNSDGPFPSRCEIANGNDVCNGTNREDTCVTQSPCAKFGCIELESGVCGNVPSIIRHIEECKQKFLGLIEASLCNIGKDRNPEKIIRSTLKAARDKETARLMEGRKRSSDVSESSSTVPCEVEALKKFCTNDLLMAAYKRLVKCEERDKHGVCGPCGIPNAVPCVENSETEKVEKYCGKARGDYKDEEISEFVKIIDFKLREELTRKLRKNLCAEDSLALKNSYYCVANLCPCMTKSYSLKGPLVLGPFNFAPNEEPPSVCRKPVETTESVSSSASTLQSFRYSDCIDNGDSSDSDDSASLCINEICGRSKVKARDVVCPGTKVKKVKCNDAGSHLNDVCNDSRITCDGGGSRMNDVCHGTKVICDGGGSRMNDVCNDARVICDRGESRMNEVCNGTRVICDGGGSRMNDVCNGTRVICTGVESARKSEKCSARSPIVIEHQDDYVYCQDRRAEEVLANAYSKRSEEVAKWGKCVDLVDSVLYERDERMKICKDSDFDMESMKKPKEDTCRRENGNEDEYLFTHVCGVDERCIPKLQACKREEKDDDECKDICSRPSHTCRVGYDGVCVTGDDFDNLDRFHDIGSHGFSKLCRKQFKWVHCITKNWRDLISNPYIVVHLPSMGFCNELRCRASKTFDYLQNAQVGRIGWLEDPNAQVIYVFPTPQSEELVSILQGLIQKVRPDIDISKRLWIILPEPKCIMKKCVSGSANLFHSPDSYRRVRNLTAGRHGILVPGVIDQKDVFIGCELKIPIIGPPIKFQKKLLNKSYIMELLNANNIQHPPFLHVHSFGQLCRGMAIMALEFPVYKVWFLKIDNGFSGQHTAIIRFQKGILGSALKNIQRTCSMSEDYLCKLLAETLPFQLQVQKSVYKNPKEFFHDLEQYGGIIQACPCGQYDVVSIGAFVEHDLAKPVFLTAAEVIHFGGDIRNDMAYFLRQNKILQDDLDKLVESVGTILRNEHVIGYFGIDVVTFRDQFDPMTPLVLLPSEQVQQTWVVDVDPYYTDLIAFCDWVKFCIGPCKVTKECTGETKFINITELLTMNERHAICCGKLFGTGLSKYCGNSLTTLCEQNQIYYDNKEKLGCMVYPIDSHNRALSIVSIYSTRLLAMQKFIEALKVLNQLALRNNGRESFTETICFSNYFKGM